MRGESDIFSSCFFQPSSAYGLVRLELEVYPLLWRDPAKQRSLLKTARMAQAACLTLSRSLVRVTESGLNLALLLIFLMTGNFVRLWNI